jgi:hypothetical protein
MASTDSTRKIPHPLICPDCERRGTVRLKVALDGEVFVWRWYCKACEQEWPAKHDTRKPTTAA